jgi:hypothetical protein
MGAFGDGESAGVVTSLVVEGVVGCGETVTPGGDCGFVRMTPGGAVGSELGRDCGGTGWFCCVPGGRVASCCAGVMGTGVAAGAGVGAGVWAKAVKAVAPVMIERSANDRIIRRTE